MYRAESKGGRRESEGTVIDVATPNDEGGLTFLMEGLGPNPQGITPVFDGIDVFPGKTTAEVIVRWKHPGNGGHRTLEKFLYDSRSMKRIARATFKGRYEFVWTSEEASKDSHP